MDIHLGGKIPDVAVYICRSSQTVLINPSFKLFSKKEKKIYLAFALWCSSRRSRPVLRPSRRGRRRCGIAAIAASRKID